MVVNELSQATFTIIPLDETGLAFTPSNTQYRVDDLVSSNELIAWTAATPSTSITIVVAASIHAMVDINVEFETKILTVETDFGTASAHVEQHEYQVRNLHFAQVV